MAVRLCLIPDSAPPFDGERSPPGTGDPNLPPAGGGPAHARAAWSSGDSGPPGSQAPSWPGRFAQALAETLAGSRPTRQLVPWTTEQARSHIQRLGPQLSSRQQPRVRRVVTFSPASGVLEMSVVVGFGTRVRALAVRLEREPPAAVPGERAAGEPRWLCTAVEAA